MRITNNVDGDQISDISVSMRVTDELGLPVAVTSNSSDTSAKFFVRISNLDGIASVDGTGVVQPKTTATIDWLMIPAPGAAGTTPFGKKYLVGATLKYKFQGEVQTLEVDPDVITVKPLPSLTLDYFMTQDVVADDPLTPIIESAEPFTLGVRVKNTGLAKAANLTIDSAQPKIVENNQGLLIGFQLLGSFVDDSPAQNSLLMKFGDIAGGTSKMGRWIMQTTLAGKFTEFGAKFSHADELGGSLTSLMQATNAHILLHDVRVDLPGRDAVRDYLALEPTGVKVFESNGPDSDVTDRSAAASLVVGPSANGVDTYTLNFPATPGFAYVRLKDPYSGTRPIGRIIRSDAKIMAPENAWLSKTRNKDTKKWEYYVNFFDVATTGVYSTDFDPPSAIDRPPELQFIADHTVEEGKQVSFIVEGSSAAGKPVALSAAPLPAGARFTQQAADPQYPGLARAVFDWTPEKGSAGNYVITYTADDGARNAQRVATVTVTGAAVPAGPGLPAISAPLSGSVVGAISAMKPTFAVLTSSALDDATKQVQFELYADAQDAQLVATGIVDKAAATVDANGATVVQPTTWTPPLELGYSGKYWWRVRSFDGTLYSAWVYGRFTIASALVKPTTFNATSPAVDAEVPSATPTLSWTNAQSVDGSPTAYAVVVYKDAELATIAAQSADIAEMPGGYTSWTVPTPLDNRTRYYWRVVAKSRAGGWKTAIPRAFTVNTTNQAPGTPTLVLPQPGSVLDQASASLTVNNAVDPEGSPVSYVFELDRTNTFDSGAKRVSGVVPAGSTSTSWSVADLAENGRYWWRVKASDGKAESPWVVGEFMVNTTNEAPPVPLVRNPGNGAWTSLQQPSLEASPVLDPEGSPVQYRFEVFKDSGLTQKVTEGVSHNSALIVPSALPDKSWYWWRVRAIDGSGTASAWSAPSRFYVHGGVAQPAALELVQPARVVLPVINGTGTTARKFATIAWEGADPNRQPLVSLYYSLSKSGFSGLPVVEGLRQPLGATGGRYEWDISALAPGAYSIFVVLQDGQGVSKTYAPGMVVVPNPVQTGTLTLGDPGLIYEGSTATLGLAWTGASGKPMHFPFGGKASTANYDFLFQSEPRASGTMLFGAFGEPLCHKQMVPFASQFGPILTEDLNFAGRVVMGNAGRFSYASSNTGDETLRICDIQIVSERRLDAIWSEFTVRARLSNLGSSLLGASATPSLPAPGSSTLAPAAGTEVSGTLQFGAINTFETGVALNTMIVKAKAGNTGVGQILRGAVKWSVQVNR
ncbi:hypothetical protein [Pseudoduganella sp. R-34]|uniref:hypothetical protein n=1 Tax=Pseudoduganella sp. R-34 TaxID=3404062 RepID=UPI003CE7A475